MHSPNEKIERVSWMKFATQKSLFTKYKPFHYLKESQVSLSCHVGMFNEDEICYEKSTLSNIKCNFVNRRIKVHMGLDFKISPD